LEEFANQCYNNSELVVELTYGSLLHAGIEKVEVDTNCQKVVVSGYTHKNKILKAIRRGGLKADFWSAQNELLNAYVSANYTNLRFNPFSFF